ncbi:MAG: hypothetical protein PWP23_2587 [Candidatus Sumerlaeota bacterium]|nr:hypothetical protein [Candidatus Sumerlaeota bacterium]
MSRERFDELLDDWAEGRLAGSDAREFEALLLSNPNWRGEAECHRSFLQLVRTAPRPTAPPRLMSEAMRRARSGEEIPNPYEMHQKVIDIQQTIEAKRRKQSGTSRRWIYGLAAALLVTAGGYTAFQMTMDARDATPSATESPAAESPGGEAMPAGRGRMIADARKVHSDEELVTLESTASQTEIEERNGFERSFFSHTTRDDSANRKSVILAQLLNEEIGPAPAREARPVAAQPSATGAAAATDPLLMPDSAPKELARAESPASADDLSKVMSAFAPPSPSRMKRGAPPAAKPAEPTREEVAYYDPSEGTISHGDVWRVKDGPTAPAPEFAASARDELPAVSGTLDEKSPAPAAPASAPAAPAIPERDLIFLMEQGQQAGGFISAMKTATGETKAPLGPHVSEQRHARFINLPRDGARELTLVFADRKSLQAFLTRVRTLPLPAAGDQTGSTPADYLDVTRYTTLVSQDERTGYITLAIRPLLP